MKIRAQIAMVLNLDKCIGCHTCSVTCKNVWTSRPGMEYAWFNNVETKPGIGYPKDWENQERWNGGWVRKKNGKLQPKIGGKWRVLAKIFANPDLPEIDDYYEPFTFDYAHLQSAPEIGKGPNCVWKGVPVNCGPRGLPTDTNLLFHNNGDGTFSDVSVGSGIARVTGRYASQPRAARTG